MSREERIFKIMIPIKSLCSAFLSLLIPSKEFADAAGAWIMAVACSGPLSYLWLAGNDGVLRKWKLL